MKTLLRITALSFGLSLLVGCASTQNTAYGDAPPQRTAASSRVDEKYVAYVESVARHRGTQVMWVNMPQKRVPRTEVE